MTNPIGVIIGGGRFQKVLHRGEEGILIFEFGKGRGGNPTKSTRR